MTSEQLKFRTKQYSLSIIDLVEKLPITTSSRVVSYQIAKSGTSVGANYRAVCRSRSNKEFIAKMEIVLEESDETLFWLEIIKEKKWIEDIIIDNLWKEGNELTAIFVSSLKTAKAK
ncbi:four helix bundle protein [Flavobacterium sp. LaA7.5]|nr:four helix bundle protein [Flavobacterium salilacus subsp. altitudinum]